MELLGGARVPIVSSAFRVPGFAWRQGHDPPAQAPLTFPEPTSAGETHLKTGLDKMSHFQLFLTHGIDNDMVHRSQQRGQRDAGRQLGRSRGVRGSRGAGEVREAFPEGGLASLRGGKEGKDPQPHVEGERFRQLRFSPSTRQVGPACLLCAGLRVWLCRAPWWRQD